MDKQLDTIFKEYLESQKENFIDDLRGLLAFNSVKGEATEGKPFGGEVAKALDYMMDLCEQTNLKTNNYDYYCMDATYGDHKEDVASLSHLDIVPAGNGWKHPPFAGEMEGSIIFGRGVGDDKGPAMAGLYAVKALLKADVKLNRNIKLIFGCDEETGMSDMKYYLKKAKAPEYSFSPDAHFPVIYAEKHIAGGAFTGKITGDTALISLEGGSVQNAVPNFATAKIKYDKCPENTDKVNYTLDNGILAINATGIAAHASTPEEGENAIITLANGIYPLLNEEDAAKPLIKNIIEHLSASDGSGLKINCVDEATGELTFNPGVISLEDSVIKIIFDIRHPVTIDHKNNLDKLKSALPLFKLEDFYASEGIYRPVDGVLVSTLMDVYREVTGDTDSVPVSMGGGTYARALPNAVAFGPAFPNGNCGGAHTVDEYMDIDELLKAARIYAHCFYRLANA